MDDGVSDSVAPVNDIYLQAKEGEYIAKTEGGARISGSHEMIMPAEGDYTSGTNSDIPCSSAHFRNDGVIVEELTLRNYNGENLAVVGTSNSRDGRHGIQNQWQHLYQIAGGKGTSKAWEDNGKTIFPELLSENPHGGVKNVETEHLASNKNKESAGIRTKILSKSGFSEFFVKHSLKGKGIVRKGPAREGYGVESRSLSNLNTVVAATVSDSPVSTSNKKNVPSSIHVVHDGVRLREWLEIGRRKASKLERLYIFRQILNLVDHSHSQGLSLQHLRPSFFSLSTANQVVYLGSFVPQENVEDPTEDQKMKRTLGQSMHSLKKQKFAENQMYNRHESQFISRSGFKAVLGKSNLSDYSDSSNYNVFTASQPLSLCASDLLEESWYASPEERIGRGWSFSSNIYVLGVLLFELLGCFDSESARAAAMADLRHRILPSNFLSENPKEAGFCLWLLHPEPSSRPTAREVLKSNVISGIEESFEDELSSSIEEEDTESELLSYFLLSIEEQKQKDRTKLEEEIKSIEADIKEIERRRTVKPKKSEQFVYNSHLTSVVNPIFTPGTSHETRFVKNISQLESAYFSMRSDIQSSINDVMARERSDLLRERDNQTQIDEEMNSPTDHVGGFFSGLCKYARYSKFKVRGILRNGEFSSSANVICSMSFDRDQEYFATAGISKRIKIFEFQSLFNESVDVHYPAVEMSNNSRLSCVCWNNYIRNYLASTDYDGTVKLWDAGTGQVVSQYIEHNTRAWSVDFSRADPTKLASGSDDYSVKLWSINEKNSLHTIRSIANACCVQFSSHSSHLLSFGSADYKTYCYDLRNTSSPWCILAGHDKAVSYVKFLDSETLVTASTDNTLKIWDLNKTSSSTLSTSACILTSKGHTNEKNFVGLSVADGYIACGSETNEVYAYYRSLPMPITSHKFGSIDPISGKETDDQNGQFVSSVCWKQNSDMLLAANSSGCIKVLQMV